MADDVEKKGLAVLKILRDMHCRYNVNSELVIMKHVEEISNCAARWKLNFTEVNGWHRRNQKSNKNVPITAKKNKHFEDLNKEDTKIYNLSEMENLASSNDKNMPSFSWKCKILRGSHFIFE